jgi:hypothetical protein
MFLLCTNSFAVMLCRFFLLCFTALALVSCSNQSWKIQLKDGRVLSALDEPQFQSKTGYYRYRNENDREAMVQAREVLLIERQR